MGEKLGVGSWRVFSWGENDDELWETPTFSLTDKRVRALARLSGVGIPEYVDEPNTRAAHRNSEFLFPRKRERRWVSVGSGEIVGSARVFQDRRRGRNS